MMDGAAGATAATRKVPDPVLAELVSALRDGPSSRDRRDQLARQGLLVRVDPPSRPGYGGSLAPRYLPTTLGQIIADKGRLPTETETARAKKQLDKHLKRSGVTGDVTSGGFSYTQPARESERIEQQRLIRDRQSIRAFQQARAAGTFQAVKLRNAGARAARDRLADWLDEIAAARTYDTSLRERAATLRSGVFSVADAQAAVDATTGMFDEPEDVAVYRDAIRIGLGLPSQREQLILTRDREQAALRGTLDRIHAGERLVTDDGEVAWSPITVPDRRVRRAAFGHHAAAARMASDYYQQAIIELADGSVGHTEVKRAHSDLRPYIDTMIENDARHARAVAEAAEQEQRARTLLRRWARSR